MALTKSLITEQVMGKNAVKVFNVTADAVATSLATGMKRIHWAQVTIQSTTTDGTMGCFNENKGPAGTAIAGELAMTSVIATTRTFRVVCYGSR